jgi:hypothetical protein
MGASIPLQSVPTRRHSPDELVGRETLRFGVLLCRDLELFLRPEVLRLRGIRLDLDLRLDFDLRLVLDFDLRLVLDFDLRLVLDFDLRLVLDFDLRLVLDFDLRLVLDFDLRRTIFKIT